MSAFNGRILTVPAVLSLVVFLSYSSQYLFLSLDPRPLSRKESIYFNINIVAILTCYARSVLTDPGRVPKTIIDASNKQNEEQKQAGVSNVLAKQRWCRVCNHHKPPRSHHCRVCKRCIPKMDHHCPWTYNCVSYRTYPHFFRFVFFSVTAMSTLEYHLWIRSAYIWRNRHVSMYYGPSVSQLAHLFLLDVSNSITLFALTILLLRTMWSLLWNITTIEDWEMDRHETLLRRARVNGGYLDGPDGIQVRIKRQEFPFDIGIWANLKQSMGTGNVLAWLWPLARSPSMQKGYEFETNGLEDPSIGWPPPDPDRIPRVQRRYGEEETQAKESFLESTIDVEAFRKRQEQDLRCRNVSDPTYIRRRQPFRNRYDPDAVASNDASSPDLYATAAGEGEESWRDGEGQRLKDFGLDEVAEFYDQDEEEIPLAELIRRKKALLV